jgi:thiamine monophosphate kinase
VYNGFYIGANTGFTAGEIVYQGATAVSNTSATQADIGLLDNSSARFHSNTADGQTVYLTSKLGRINSANTLTGLASGAIFTINTKNEPDLIPESGDVLYLENFDAVTRSNTTSETVKLILSY